MGQLEHLGTVLKGTIGPWSLSPLVRSPGFITVHFFQHLACTALSTKMALSETFDVADGFVL